MIVSFDDFRKQDLSLNQSWLDYSVNGLLSKSTRTVISESWQRCKRLNVDHQAKAAPISLGSNELRENLSINKFLIDMASPHLSILLQSLQHTPSLITLTDHEGLLLKTYGTDLKTAEKINLMPGAYWREEDCGTNGIGTVLSTNKELSIFGYEHFCVGWHNWVCTGAPIHDPLTKKLLGVINIAGDKKTVALHNTALAKSVAQLIEHSIYEHLFFAENSTYSKVLNAAAPVVVFDENFQIMHLNYHTVRELHLISGDHLQLFPPEVNANSSIPVRTQYQDDRGGRWQVETLPFVLSNRMLGRIAHFQPVAGRAVVPQLTKPVSEQDAHFGFKDIITQDPAMHHIKKLGAFMAANEMPVLITGETGSGKELFARAIHNHSPRHSQAFIAINCGAIPKELIASELFGYVKGAFTSASQQGKKGVFQLADKGTLFLDEIGELPLELQTYLLRILETKMVYPLGSEKGIPVDVRIVAATNRNLQDAVREGKFRSDLLFRLKVMQLEIPPLRNRKEDIPLLFSHFAKQESLSFVSIDEGVFQALKNYHWPGNVRELRNCYMSALLNLQFRGGNSLCMEDLPKEYLPETRGEVSPPHLTPEQDAFTDKLIKALKQAKGNKSKAAKLLGISRMTIYRKLQELEDLCAEEKKAKV